MVDSSNKKNGLLQEQKNQRLPSKRSKKVKENNSQQEELRGWIKNRIGRKSHSKHQYQLQQLTVKYSRINNDNKVNKIELDKRERDEAIQQTLQLVYNPIELQNWIIATTKNRNIKSSNKDKEVQKEKSKKYYS
jgi:hypothetical protein